MLFYKLFSMIANTIPNEEVELFHNGTGYFNGIASFKEEGWFKFYDQKKSRKGIYFRKGKGKGYVCIHERYTNGYPGIIVSTGKYFNGALKEEAIEVLITLFEGGNLKDAIEKHLDSYWGDDLLEFQACLRGREREMLLDLK